MRKIIHYFGTPLGGTRDSVGRFLKGRHAFVPFPRQEDLGIISEACQSFAFDNGAFSAWKSGEPITDWNPYYEWVGQWKRHPGFDWAIIPDVIDGTEQDNDALVSEWPHGARGVPVWHLHESMARLLHLADDWPRIALGSSGEWPDPGADGWWQRINSAMSVLCDMDGKPRCRLHGLRMLDPAIFYRMPLASADSTNVARNAARKSKEVGCSISAARELLAERVEVHNSAATWKPIDKQGYLTFKLAAV